MKEVVKWNNNPREMLVWDDNENFKLRRKVIAILKADVEIGHPVVAINYDENDVTLFRHCKEIVR